LKKEAVEWHPRTLLVDGLTLSGMLCETVNEASGEVDIRDDSEFAAPLELRWRSQPPAPATNKSKQVS
jgi:hypothetical protein